MVRRRRPLTALVAAVATFTATMARADDASVARAQGLFDEALVLIKAGKYAEACPKLEESDKLDPGMGTEYRLAECYESAGKIASAWTVFRAVADSAQREGKGERAAVAIRRAADLAPRLPMLLVVVPESSRIPGLSVRIDGNPIPSSDWAHKIPVDPGKHLMAARAPKRIGWVSSISPLEGTLTTVTVPVLGDGTLPPLPPPPPLVKAPPPVAPGLSAPRIAALTAGGIGVVGLVVGTVFGIRAASQWSSAKASCLNPDDGRTCSPAGIRLSKDAIGSSNVADVSFLVGGVALLVGTVVWVRYPAAKPLAAASSLSLAPVLGPGAGGARLEGSF